MSIFKSFVFWILFAGSLNAFGQISHEREWKGVELEELSSQDFVLLSAPDLSSVQNEDLLEDRIKEIPYRFGIDIEKLLFFEQESKLTVFQNGSAVRRMGISSKNAKSLNLIFKTYDLPSGGWMHIYTPDKSQLLGAFTDENRHHDGQFSTSWIFNDSLIIEVYYPHYKLESSITISHVIYGYRGIDKSDKYFGDAGTCNVNVNCTEGQPWLKQKQSVVMILASNNTRICSGAMVNNVREDGKPFLLTANHCPVSTNNVFVFNYESPSCSPSIEPTIDQTISGAQIRARDAKSDFALMELNLPPPASYNVFYAGWNNTGEIPVNSFCMHHPSGDVKKISVDKKSSISSGYYLMGDDHWKIESWDVGTTENGSSGSPLFDHHGRITGQLHGGEASCSVTEGEDYFGKFSVSWNNDPSSARQLKFWLDPDNTGTTILNGRSANETPGSIDVSLLGFSNLNVIQCGSTGFVPVVKVKNRGLQTIDSVNVDFFVNNVFQQSVKWLSPLISGSTKDVSGTSFSLPNGYYKLKAKVYVLGQVETDTSNNMVDLGFMNIAEPVTLEMIVQTDDYGDEFSWEISSSTGSLMHSKGDYPTITGGSLYRDTLCLFDGCFTLTAMDAANDGICCNYGNGFYILRDLSSGDTLVKNTAFSSRDTSHFFCTGDSCSIIARAHIRECSSSKSADGEIKLELLSGNPPFSFKWSNGATGQNVSNLLPGFYSVIITDDLDCSDSLFYQLGISTGISANSRVVSNELRIFPNPGKGEFYLNGLNSQMVYQLRITDLSGRILYRKTMINSQLNEKLNLSFLGSGMYILNVYSPEEFHSMKLLLEK